MYVPLSTVLFQFICFLTLYKLYLTVLNLLQAAIFIQLLFLRFSGSRKVAFSCGSPFHCQVTVHCGNTAA